MDRTFRGEGSLGVIIAIVVVVLIGWLIWDNLIANHWSLVQAAYDITGTERSFITGDSYHSADDCMAGASREMVFDHNNGDDNTKYTCGYKCRTNEGTIGMVTCERFYEQ